MHPERAIVTDTASSLTQIEAAEKRINLIPINITFIEDGKELEYNDFSITPEEIYDRMKGGLIPKTAAPSPIVFADEYQRLYQEGSREILSVHLSDKNSTTYNSARLGAEMVLQKIDDKDLKIEVVNSRTLSLAQYFVVEKGQSLLNTDLPLDEIAKQVYQSSENTKLFFATGPEGVKYLHHGGRVSSIQSVFGSMLQIVPIITLEPDGKAVMLEKCRGEKKARIQLMDTFEKELYDRKKEPAKVGIVYTRDQEVGEEIKHRLSEIVDLSKTKLIGPKEAGSILAPHGGPRLAYIAGLWQ